MKQQPYSNRASAKAARYLTAALLTLSILGGNAAVLSSFNTNLVTQLKGGLVREGASAQLSLRVENTADAPLENASVAQRLPVGLVLRSASSTQGNCTVEGNQVLCRLGTLNAHTAVTLTVNGDVAASVPAGKESLELTVQSGVLEGVKPVLAVEDPVVIVVARDFGDAPDNPYPTLMASNGARHRVGALFLGNGVDAELDGQPTIPANGDDLALAPDDEDGVRFLDPLIAGGSVRIDVRSSGPGFLSAWIDYNHNGIWEVPERILGCVPVVAGVQRFVTLVPPAATPGWVYARFRLASNCVPDVTGYADSGEVEDYRLKLRPKQDDNALRIVGDRNGKAEVNWGNPEGVLEAALSPSGPFLKLRDAVSGGALPTPGKAGFFRLGTEHGEFDFVEMLRAAELVFEGTVLDIQYRQSHKLQEDEVELPHTFVKFQINALIKGKFTPTTLWLRFLGGPAPDGRVLRVGHSPLFSVGDRSILFVRHNMHAACPVIGGGNGHLRIHDGQVFTDDGRPLRWNSEAQIEIGSDANVFESRHHGDGAMALERRKVLETDPKEPASGNDVLSDAEPLTSLRFREIIGALKSAVGNGAKDALIPDGFSADPNTRFVVKNPRQAAPRKRLSLPGNPPPAALDDEGKKLRANGDNPVLK